METSPEHEPRETSFFEERSDKQCDFSPLISDNPLPPDVSRMAELDKDERISVAVRVRPRSRR